MIRLVWCIGAVLVMTVVAAAAETQKEASDADSKQLFETVCASCHDLGMVTSRHATKEEWQATVDAMANKGANATDDQFQQIVDYLAKYYGPAKAGDAGSSESATKLNVNTAPSEKIAALFAISSSEADAILHYREANGNFKNMADLMKVPGIDTKKIEAKKDRITF